MAYPTDPSQVGLTTAKSELSFFDTNNGRTLQTSGASYENRIFRGTTLIFHANNITFTNCWFYATSGFWLVYGSGNPQNIRFINCEFGLSSSDSTVYDPDGFTGGASEKGCGAMQFEMVDCYSHHQSDGHYLDAGCIVDHCYMHDAVYATEGMHLDILQISGNSSGAIVRNSWLELNLAADNVIVPTTGGPTAGVFIQSNLGPSDDVTVTGNYIDGFGFYGMQVTKNAPSLDGLTVTNNRFGRTASAAPLTIHAGATNVTRFGNRFADTLELIPGDTSMAATVKASGNNIATSGDVTLTLSASAQTDDWLIVGLDVRNATDTVSVSGGAGTWVLELDESLGSGLRKRVYKYKVPAGDTPGTTSFTFDISNNFRTRSVVWALVRGADTTNAVDAAADAQDSTFDTTYTAPAVTTTANDHLVLVFMSDQSAENTFGSPTSPTLTEVTNAKAAGATLTSYLFSFVQATAGSTGSITATATVGGTSLGATVAIKSGAASTFSGSGTPSQAAQTSTATGSHTPPNFAATGTPAQAAQTSTAAGTFTAPVFSGTSAVTQAAQTSTAAGTFVTLTFSGAAAITQAAQLADAGGTFVPGALTGTAAITQEPQTAAGVGAGGIQIRRRNAVVTATRRSATLS